MTRKTWWCCVHGKVLPIEIPYRVRRITGQRKGKVCPVCFAPVLPADPPLPRGGEFPIQSVGT